MKFMVPYVICSGYQFIACYTFFYWNVTLGIELNDLFTAYFKEFHRTIASNSIHTII